MPYKTGKAKSLEAITLADILQYPIWEWAWDTEGADDQDETWQRPIIDTDRVLAEMFSPIITLRVAGTHLFATAEYFAEEEYLTGISLWINGRWGSLPEAGLPLPITLLAVPKIEGIPDVAFLFADPAVDRAVIKRME